MGALDRGALPVAGALLCDVVFNWGRIVSMTAPLITCQIAWKFGLEAAISLAIAGFGLGAIVWFAITETLPNRGGRAPR